MRGKRCKKLRKDFLEFFGRNPNRTRYAEDGYWPSEWRRLKKHGLHDLVAYYNLMKALHTKPGVLPAEPEKSLEESS